MVDSNVSSTESFSVTQGYNDGKNTRRRVSAPKDNTHSPTSPSADPESQRSHEPLYAGIQLQSPLLFRIPEAAVIVTLRPYIASIATLVAATLLVVLLLRSLSGAHQPDYYASVKHPRRIPASDDSSWVVGEEAGFNVVAAAK